MEGDRNLRTARVQLRLDPVTKRKIERAAAMSGRSVSEFVVTAAASEADRAAESQGKTILSAEDWEVFYEALVNPPPPNLKLKKALRAHSRLRG